MSKKSTVIANKPGKEILDIQGLSEIELRKQLRQHQIELNFLLEITQAINSNFSTSSLFEIYEYILTSKIGVKKLAVFIKNEKWEPVCSNGIDKKELKKINIEKDIIDFKEITSLEDLNNPNLRGFELVVPVYHKDIPLGYVLLGSTSETEGHIFSDIRFIQTISNIICVAVENKKFVREQIQQDVLKKELELGAQMQTMLFPNQLPKNEYLEMQATYFPHNDIGGDYYDFIQINDEEIVFCIADVSGKGFAAGLIMASLQANLHTLLIQTQELTELVPILNTRVLETAKREKFITLFIAKYNVKTRILKYLNAGHNPPVLYRDKGIEQLQEGCTILGMFDDLPKISEGTIKVDGEAVLVCYTDGLVEVENDKKEAYQLDRLSEFIMKYAYSEIEVFHERLWEKVNQYKEEQPFTDDVTVLSCRIFA
ncbi:MAG: SpoIIE family protein phosphatase [Bacteroidia bacterium]|nr:SpoIIE family protein phosphatase [Bacteroidia bacterium]